MAGPSEAVQPHGGQYPCSGRLPDSRLAAPEHRYGGFFCAEVEARRQSRCHLGRRLSVGSPDRRGYLCLEEAECGSRYSGRGRTGSADHRCGDASFRGRQKRERIRQSYGCFRLHLQHGHRVVWRYSLLLPYHGSDAGRRCCRAGFQYGCNHAGKKQRH